jgi:DNA-binding NarL/FixJ family response regulator
MASASTAVPVRIVCPRCECQFNHRITVEPQKVRSTSEILLPYQLTPKELQIADLMIQGISLHEAAVEIGSPVQVVKNYNRIIYRKVGVTNRLNLILKVEEERYT